MLRTHVGRHHCHAPVVAVAKSGGPALGPASGPPTARKRPSSACRSTCGPWWTPQRRRGHHVLRRTGRRVGGQRRPGPQGPLLPGLLRHPGRRLRHRTAAPAHQPPARASTRSTTSALVGVGNLGQALGNYRGFSERGFHVVAAFDSDPAKVGRRLGAAGSTPCPNWPVVVREKGITMALIATPASVAQDIADRLVEAGVTSVLNFAPAVLNVAPHVLRPQGRPRRGAADPGLLRAFRAVAGRPRPGRRQRHLRPTAMPIDAPVYPVALLLTRPPLPGGGGRARGRPQGERAAGRRGRGPRGGHRSPASEMDRLARAGQRWRSAPTGRVRSAGYWLVVAATGDAAGQPGRLRRRRGGPGVGQFGRRPRPVLVHPPGRGPPGPVTRGHFHLGLQPRPGLLAEGPCRRAQMGPELAELAELLAEAAGQAEGAGPQHRRRRLAARASDWAMLDLIRSKDAEPKQRSASRRVYRRSRDKPPDRAPGGAGAADRRPCRPAQGPGRPGRRARTWTRWWSCRPACGPRSTPWSTASTGPWPTSGSSWPPGAATRPKSSRAASTPTSTKRP